MEQKPAGPILDNPLATQPVKGLLWKFAIPGILSSVVNSAHNIVDQIFIGQSGIGDLGIGATNIAFPLTSITTAMAILFGMGAAARFSILLGKKEIEQAKKILGNALVLLVLTGIFAAAFGLIFLEPMLRLFGATDLIMPYALSYTFVIVLGLPFGIFATGMSYFIRADGNPNYSSFVLLSGAIFNIIFDPIFLYLFQMGIEGIALATMLGQVLSASLALYYLLKKFQSVRFTKEAFHLQGKTILSFCSLGAAPCFTHLIAIAVQIIQMNMLRHYGALSIYGSEAAIAGAGAVMKVMMVLMSCVIGIALGCQPIYGFNLGAKLYYRVIEAYRLAIRYGTMIAVTAFLCMQLFPMQILGIFGSDDPMFYEFSVRFMRIYLFMTFANAIQPITSTFFTSIGRAQLGFWMSLIRQGLLLIPLLLILPMIFGIEGLFFAGPVSDGIAVIIVIYFARRELKKLTALQTEQSTL